MEFHNFASFEREYRALSVKELAALLDAYNDIGDPCIEILDLSQDLDEDGYPTDMFSVTLGEKCLVLKDFGPEKTFNASKKGMMEFLEKMDKKLS